MNWTIGVDPGGQGALGLIDPNGKAVKYEKMGGIPEIDDFFYESIILSKGKLTCVYEQHHGGGADCNANTHRSAGLYEGMFKYACHVHGVNFHPVSPQTWKAHFGLIQRSEKKEKGAPKPSKAEQQKAQKEKRIAAKAASCKLVKELCPGIQLVLPRCKNEHDGIAESVLLAIYGKRKGL